MKKHYIKFPKPFIFQNNLYVDENTVRKIGRI